MADDFHSMTKGTNINDYKVRLIECQDVCAAL